MKISLGTVLGLISIPFLANSVFLNAAYAEGNDTVCNNSSRNVRVNLRTYLRDSRVFSSGSGYVPRGSCKTIYWRGAIGAPQNSGITEWIKVSDNQGPFSLDRYSEGVYTDRIDRGWVRMATGHITVE